MAITLPFGETISVLLEIGYPVDEFTLDSATFGALDTGSGVLDGTLAGDDVAEFVQEISVTRGRTEQLQQFTTGTCQITLLNNDRRFDPVNTSSPYFDPVDQQSGVQPRRAISVSVDGTMIFKGRITDIDIEYGNGPTDNSTVSIMAADDMLVLANSVVEANVTPAVERSDVRLGTLLDLPEISPTTPRSFETGTVDLGAYAITAGTNALTYAQKINESEQGYLFVDGAGTLNFKKRVISVFDSSSVSFADDGTAIDFVNVGISYGEELLFNKVIVAREGGSEQISDNPTSQASYGVAALSLTNMLLETDAASALLSADLLEKYGVPQYRFDNLVLAMSDLSVPQRASVLSLELADTVKVKRTFSVGTPASVQKGAGIQRITHRITPTQHSIQFGLEQKLIVNPLVLAEPDFPETRYNAAIYPSFESATLTNYSSAQSSDVRSATFAYAGSYSYETTMSSTSDSNIGAFQAGALALSIDEGTRTNQFTIGEFGTTITRTNLLPNPNMDNASVGTYYQAISITETRSTDYAYSGTYSLKGVIDTASSQYFQVLQTAGAMIDVTAGQTYTFSAYIYLPASNTANSTWRAQLFFWNGSSYTSAYSGTTTTIVRGNWTRLDVTATVPTGYYKALPRIMSTSVLAVGQEAYVDAWLLENTSNLLPYFDGTYADTYTGYTLTEQAWNGTADASTSTASWGLSSTLTGSTLDGTNQLDGYLVTPTSWIASAYFYIPAGSLLVGRTVALSLEGGDSGVVTAVTSVPANLAQGQWVRASLLFTLNNLPTTTPAFVARLSGTLSSAVGQKIYTDGWLVEKTTTAKGWFDGYSTSVSGFTSVTSAAWDGTADESSSTMTGLPDPYGDTTYSTLDGTNALT